METGLPNKWLVHFKSQTKILFSIDSGFV